MRENQLDQHGSFIRGDRNIADSNTRHKVAGRQTQSPGSTVGDAHAPVAESRAHAEAGGIDDLLMQS